MPLQEFREMFGLTNKYSKLKDLRIRVLEPSKERMKEGADVYFNYNLTKVGGSRSYNYISFTIHGNNKNRSKEKKTDMHVMVYNMLCIPWPNHKSSRARDLVDYLAQDPVKLEDLYRRLKKLKNELDTGEKEIKDISALIKHILKEDYGVFG